MQLPAGVTPLAYQLDLTVMPERETFSGRVRIDIRFDAATDGFWMHGRGLDVDKVQLHAGREHRARDLSPGDPRRGGADIRSRNRSSRKPRNSTSAIAARFSELLEGLFRVKVGADWYAFTQFEPIDARGVFPGFDEPRFKTPFTLSIVAPKSATVAGTRRSRRSDSLPDDTKRVLFHQTPPLPTYLLAFAVGPLDVVDGGNLRDAADAPVPLRGLAASGPGPSSALRLSNTPEIVALLDDYFGQPYPFPEARPGGGAVAAWARWRTRDSSLMANITMLFGEKPPLYQQRTFANVHTHELAHQWFGNSVTMSLVGRLVAERSVCNLHGEQDRAAWRPSYREADAQIRAASLSRWSGDGSRARDASVEPIVTSTTSRTPSTALRTRKARACST